MYYDQPNTIRKINTLFCIPILVKKILMVGKINYGYCDLHCSCHSLTWQILLTAALTHYRRQILDWSKLKQIADDILKGIEMQNKYPIGWKTLWEKEKLLVTSNFSFSHNVFHNYISLVHQNAALCGNGLRFLFTKRSRYISFVKSKNNLSGTVMLIFYSNEVLKEFREKNPFHLYPFVAHHLHVVPMLHFLLFIQIRCIPCNLFNPF